MDDGNSVTTRLLTLLNVSATRIGKRKRAYEEHLSSPNKLNKRKSTVFAAPDAVLEQPKDVSNEDVIMYLQGKEEEPNVPENDEEGDENIATDAYEKHYGNNSAILTESVRKDVDSRSWTTSNQKLGVLGSTVVSLPASSDSSAASMPSPDISERLITPFRKRQAQLPPKSAELQNGLLSALSTRRDFYLTSYSPESPRPTREAVALHALNHIAKKRRRVLKNNERLSHTSKPRNPADPSQPPPSTAPAPEDVQDQGFTRASVLIVVPFRNSALDWFHALTSHAPSSSYQVENQSRFVTEYGLPHGAVDKLATAEKGAYPADHVETFKGNVDDNFRVGIKLTRKSMKMFAEFYGCDIILASPLGLRRSIEKEKHADYLSSIEMLIVDQVDALTMQNWEHVKFVLSHINKLPKESHDTDFSRIKSWYLDGHAAYLRQSIALAAYETPETRALFNSFTNVAGKIRTEKSWPPVPVPEGVDQNLIHFDCTNQQDEPEKRFHHFTTQVLPSVLKSAVQSTNTVIFIPSSFDFIRLHNHFRKSGGTSYTILSEYSTNQDISRARQAFFTGKKSILLISERFHFYKRYKIRGIRNLIFYGPPDHPQYFTEFLSYPFLDDDVEASDVTCRVLYCKYDWFRLERIVGTEAAMKLLKDL